MKINITVSNEKKFKKHYSEIVNGQNVNISEDAVAFGALDVIIIGLQFIYETSLSGFTWDSIKEQIFPYIQFVLSKKRKNDHVRIRIEDTEGIYNVEIPESYNIVDIKIPEKLEMYLKK
jgi:hypothetical protein